MQTTDFDRFAFVVGAPRCGTTTIARLLASHPQLSFSQVKEPHFFAMNDLRGMSGAEMKALVENEYLDRFFDPSSSARIGAEGSVSYLYAPEQLQPALKLWPDSRFIIAVRDPLSMLPSLHARLFYLGDETIRSFADAWAAIPDRAAGRRIPRSCVDPRFLRYDEAGRLGTYVERMFEAVGRERCLVVVFDDLVADSAEQSRHIVDFLGLEPIEHAPLSAERVSRQVRYPWLQRLLKRPPMRLRAYLAGQHYRRRLVKDSEGSGDALEKVMSVRKKLLRWNRVDGKSPPVPLAIQEEIRDRLRGEIDHLGALIGRDFSHWLQPKGG
jgi:hypothetical protein